MDRFSLSFGLAVGFEFLRTCSSFPVNYEDALTDSSTWLGVSVVLSLAFVVVGILFLAGCLCCRRESNGFKEFRNSVSTSNLSQVGVGFTNPALSASNQRCITGSSELSIFPPAGAAAAVTFEPLPTHLQPLPPPVQPSHAFSKPPAFAGQATNQEFSITDWFAGSNFPRDQLHYLREYGRGWFGRVVEGEARSVGEDGRNCKVVVRILREDATPSEQKFFLNEVKTFRDLSHPNVLKLVARCLETDPYLILLESCSSGDLKSFLCGNVASRTALCEQGICLRMMCDIANGLQHIIQNGFVHTDLAARNCLVTSDLTVKVGDYGTSIEMYKDDYYIAGDVALPIRWCAPESLHCTDTTIETKQVTSCANVWSFGVVLWEVCEFGALPYTSLSDDQVIVRVLGRERLKLAPPTHPSLHTAHLYSLMQMCWNEESSRPSLDHVIAMLKHLQMSRTSDSDDNFERRWETLKPNTIPVTDNATTPDALTIRSDFDSGVDLDLKASSDHDLKASNLDLKLSTDLDSSKLKLNTSATASPQLSVASSSGGEFFSPASTKFARQLSPSLTNLRGSFEDITVEVRVPSPLQQPSIAETPLSESEQFDSWLQGVDTTDEEEVKFVKNISEAIRDLDNRLAMEKTSSSSEASSRHESPAKEANAPQQNPVLDFRLGPITCLESRPLVQQLDSLQEDSLLVRRDSSSDTEEETWRGRIERGEFTEKVKEKSKSVADLMILTHIENSSDESDSLPSLTRQYSIEKNRRFVMGKTLAVPMMTSIGFGSEGNIRGAVLGEEFQESLKLLQTAWKIREAESRQASLTVDQVQNEPCVTASALNDEGGNFLGDTASENIFVQNVVGEGRGSCDSSQVKVGGVESECRENEVVSNLVSSSVGDFEDSQKKCVEIQKKSEIVEPMSLVRKSGDIVSSGVENLEDNQEKCVEIEKEARIVERIRNLECTTGDTEERGGSIDVKVRKNEVASNLVSSSVENVANFEENIQGKCVEIEKEGKFVDTMSTVDEKVIKKSEDNEREDKGIVSISELQENGKVLNIRSEDVEEEKETQIITPTSPIKENVKLFLEYGNINKEKNNIVNFTSPVQEYIKTSLKPEDIEGDIELSMKHENIKDKKTEVVNSTSPIFENKNVPVRSEDIGEEKSQVIDFTSQIQNNEKPSDSTNVATDEILSGLKCDDIQSKFAGVENVFEGNIDTTSRNATQEDEPAYKFSSKQDGSESSIEQVLGASSQHLGLEKSDSSKFEKEESDASCGISSRVKREAPQFDEHFLDKKDDVVVADKLSGGRKHDRKVENVNIDEFSPEMESDNMLKDKSSETFLVHEFLSRERGEIVAPVLTSHGSNYVEDYTTTNIIQPIESSKQDSTSLQDPNYLEEDCTTSIQPIETSKQDDSSSPQDSKYVEEDCSTSLQSTESSKQDFIPLKQTDKSSSIKIGNGIEGIDLYSTENNGASSTEIQIDITGNKGVCNTNIQTEITENNGIYNTDIQSVDAVTGNESVCNSDIQTEITENIDLCSTECYEAVKNELEMNDVMDSLPESERIYENDLVDVTNKESPDDVTSDIASSVQSPVDGSTGLLQDNLDSKETSLSELESSSQSSEQTMTVVENDPLKNDEVEMNSNSDLSVVVNGAGKLPEIVVTEAVDVELVQISQDVDNVSANYEYKPRRQIRILISNDSSDDTDSENDCDIFDDSKVPIVVSALNSASSNEPLQQKEMEIKKLDLEKSFNTSDAINIFSLDEEGGAVDKLKAINVDPNVEDNKQSSSNINESYSVILGSCEDYTLDYFKGLKTTSGKPATFDSDYSTNELSKSDSEIEDTDVSSTDREDNINNWDTFLTNSLKDKVEQDENTFNVQFNVQQLDSVGSSDVNSEDTVIDDENEESLRLNKKNLDFSRENNNLINEKNLNSRLLARDYENRNSQIIQDGGRSFVFDGNFQTKDQDRQMNEIKSRLEDVAKLSEGFQLKGAVEEEEDEGKLLTPDDERSSDSGFRDKGSLSESVEDACDEKYNLEDIEAELEEAYTKTNTESKYFSLHDENSSSSGEFSALVSFPNPCSSNKIEVADLGSDKDVKKSMEEIECLPVKDDKSGWFLHPHRATTEDDNMSGWYPSPATPELVKDDSNRSFRLDEELDAIRNELQEKLPCAQQILRDADEDNSPEEERADMVIEYGSYPIPLSPILEERESVSSNQSSIILDLHSSNVSSGRSSPMLMLERNDSFDEDEVGRKFEEDIRSALDLYSSDSIESDEVVDIVVEDLESKEETTMKVEEGKQEYDEDLLIVNTETNEAHLLESPRPKSHLAFVKKSKTTDKNCSPNVNTYTPDSISPISTGSSRTGVALSFSSPDTGNLSSFLSPSSMNSEHVDSCEYSCNIDVDVDRMKDFVPNCFDHSEMFDRLKELEDESSESSQASSERTISVPGFKEGNLENDLNSRKEGNLDVEEWENDLEIGKEENLDVKGWEKDLKIGKEGKRDVKLDKVQESFARREKENDKEELINGCVSKEKLINDCVNKEELIDFINKEKLMNDSANKEELIDCVNKKELNDSVNQEELKNVPTDLVLEKLLETKLSNSLSVDEKLVQEEVVEESKDWLKSVLLPLTNSTVQSEPVTSCTVLPKNSWPSSDELIPDSKCEGDADKKKIELNSTLALLSPNLSVGTTESMVSSFSSTPTFDTTKSLADAQMSLSISSTDGGDSQRVLVPSLRALASEVLRLHKKVLKPISDEGYSAPSKKSLTLALDSAASALSKVPMPSPEDADKGVWKPTVNQLMDLTNQSEHDAESDDLMTTSFIDGDGDNDHYNPDWESDTSDGDSEDHSSSSGEFIWKSQDDIADQQQVGMARIDEEDEEGAEDASSCGSATEFVPSIWDKAATPTKSALRRRLDDNKQESKKSVCFKEQEYHCVYEYPGEPSDSDEDDDEMDSRKRNWETPTNVDYSCFADWELAEGEAVSDRDITDLSADDYAQKSHSNKQKKNDYDFYQLGSVDYDFTQMTTDDGEFFISSSARPFQQMGFSDGSSSEFFPGSRLSFDLEDEATNQYGPENKAELNSVTEKVSKEFINNEKAVMNNLSGDVGGSGEQQVGVGGLRHTREWLKLDLPATFTSQTTKLELPVTFNSQSTAVNEEKQLESREKESTKPTFTSQSTEPDLPVTFSCQSTAVNEENQPKSQEKELPKPKFTSQSTEPDLPVTFSSQSTAVNEDKQLKSQEKESTKPTFTSQSTKLDLPVTFSTQSTAVNEEKQLKSQETESPKLEVDLKVSTVMQEANQIDVA